MGVFVICLIVAEIFFLAAMFEWARRKREQQHREFQEWAKRIGLEEIIKDTWRGVH